MLQQQNKNYHRDISFVKSMIRIAGFLCLFTTLWVGIVLLVLAEILGIVEERYE